MNASILIACSWPVSATYWATVLQKAQFVTHICHTTLPDALRVIDQHCPNLLLTETGFANGQGLELARQAVVIHPAIRCALFLPLTNEAWTQAMHTDISGYLPDGLDDSEEVIDCFVEITKGRRYISPAFRNLALLPSADVLGIVKNLSDRQKQILRLMAKGLTARQMAYEMGLSESGVNFQKENLWHKLGLRGANELKSFAGSVQGFL
ncbi:MAG: DNA-binding response regulator [Cytophagales bacterium]|nr:MAG: DNA-binding response regulator [Cytophagales bacterium]